MFRFNSNVREYFQYLPNSCYWSNCYHTQYSVQPFFEESFFLYQYSFRCIPFFPYFQLFYATLISLCLASCLITDQHSMIPFYHKKLMLWNSANVIADIRWILKFLLIFPKHVWNQWCSLKSILSDHSKVLKIL